MSGQIRSATVPCTFCTRLNRVDLARIEQRPKCGSCGRPILLDRPIRLSDADFDRVVAESPLPLVVDFYADWCAPCKAMAPALDEVAHEHQGRIIVAKLDTDRNQVVSARLGIRGIPTLIVFQNGAEKARQSGAMGRAQIESFLDLHRNQR